MGQRLYTDYDKVIRFIIDNEEIFDEYEKKYILEYASRGHKKGKMIPDLIREVYDNLDLLESEDNMYLAFIDLLDDKFQYKERSITEVGGGIIPSLAKRISSKQTTGKITVYDPRLSRREHSNDNFTLVREKFYSDTPVGDTDLLIGFMPCEATYNIIDSATRNNIDFMIALCEGGPHGDIFDFFENDQDWLNTILYLAERGVEDSNMGTLEKIYLKDYHNPYPVIYNKRK